MPKKYRSVSLSELTHVQLSCKGCHAALTVEIKSSRIRNMPESCPVCGQLYVKTSEGGPARDLISNLHDAMVQVKKNLAVEFHLKGKKKVTSQPTQKIAGSWKRLSLTAPRRTLRDHSSPLAALANSS